MGRTSSLFRQPLPAQSRVLLVLDDFKPLGIECALERREGDLCPREKGEKGRLTRRRGGEIDREGR
jgi:hypothetical protein